MAQDNPNLVRESRQPSMAQGKENTPVHYRITVGRFLVLLLLCIGFDILDLLLGVFLIPIKWFVVGLLLMMWGVNIFHAKNLTRTWMSVVVGLIPFPIPEMIAFAFMTFKFTRDEDENKGKSSAKGAIVRRLIKK